MEEKNKMIIVELKKRSSVTLPTVFDEDCFKEQHILYYSDCKSDMVIDANDKLMMSVYDVNDVKDIPMSYECILQSIYTVKK